MAASPGDFLSFRHRSRDATSLKEGGLDCGVTQKGPLTEGAGCEADWGSWPAGAFCAFQQNRPQRKRFFFLKRGRMINDTEKMKARTGKLLVRNDELLCVYRILLKSSGKLIEFYSRFEYNGKYRTFVQSLTCRSGKKDRAARSTRRGRGAGP